MSNRRETQARFRLNAPPSIDGMSSLYISLGLLVAAAVSAAAIRTRHRADAVYGALVIGGCVIGIIPCVHVLRSGTPVRSTFASALPGGDWVFGVDPLSAVFLIALFVVGAASGVYGLGYMASAPRAIARSCHALVALELVALALVLSAQSLMPFMGAWELMAIGSLLLILVEYHHAESRRAGFIYIVATHVGTLALFVLFALLARGGADWTFDQLATGTTAPSSVRNAVLGLALAGFGVKAGLFPLHFWLPPAHAAAPSHVSALLSGVVIKVGVYGVMRVVTLVGTPPAWWGWLVLAIGLFSAALGVLWALAQHDFKRLLAYHSVENIGIILIGLGVGALGFRHGHFAIGILGYAGALLHTLNHALFKSLLFLGAGTVYRVSGTRNMEALGGLARRLPLTWLAFVIGSAAIVGVPPLNGFVSEWLVFQSLFRAGQSSDSLRLAILVAPGLALVGGLALACFAKVGGVVFLGNARGAGRVEASSPSRLLEFPPLFLAAACIAIGFLPPLVLPPVLLAAGFVGGRALPLTEARATSSLVGANAITIAAVLLTAFVALVWWFGQKFRRSASRQAGTWSCGYTLPTPRMQYTASSFATPLLDLFGRLSGVRAHRGASVFHSEPVDLVLDRGVSPSWAVLERLALRLRPMQQGRLSRYLAYVIGTVAALLAYLALRGGGGR